MTPFLPKQSQNIMLNANSTGRKRRWRVKMTTRRLFNIPNPMLSFQQYVRYYHMDIPDLSDDELQTELWSLRPLLYLLPPEKRWIRDRVRELAKEYGRRHYAQKPRPIKTAVESQNKILRKVDL